MLPFRGKGRRFSHQLCFTSVIDSVHLCPHLRHSYVSLNVSLSMGTFSTVVGLDVAKTRPALDAPASVTTTSCIICSVSCSVLCTVLLSSRTAKSRFPHDGHLRNNVRLSA
jgi:hypothetical protein